MIGRCDFMKYNNNKERKYLKEKNKIKEENNSGGNLFEGFSSNRRNVLFIISLVIMSFSSFISVFAVSSYLYNSNEVSFNNSSSNSINSSNVQGAIDELYADAHNYEEMSGRVAALEGHWSDEGRWFKVNGSGDSARGIRFLDKSDVRKSAFYLGGDGATNLVAYDSSGTAGQGVLNLEGNPVNLKGTVKVNGTSISEVKYYSTSAYNVPSTTSATGTIKVYYNEAIKLAVMDIKTTTSSALTPGNFYSIGTTTFKPNIATYAMGNRDNGGNAIFTITISTAGQIVLTPLVNVPTGVGIHSHIVFFYN